MESADVQTPEILVVDDEKEIRDLLVDYLSLEGFEVDVAASGGEALNKLEGKRYDLLVLDILMPGPDGLALCRRVRNGSDVPILLLTAKDSEQDKVLGLTIGADDYVTKPFGIHELVARIKALLRRSGYRTEETGTFPGGVIESGDLRIDTAARRVFRGGEEAVLTVKEFDILSFLAENRGAVFTKKQIAERVWPEDLYIEDNTIMVHIRRLRKKIEIDPENPHYIRTVWGFGYRFRDED